MAMCVVNGASTLKPLSHACSSIQHIKAGRQVGPQPAHVQGQRDSRPSRLGDIENTGVCFCLCHTESAVSVHYTSYRLAELHLLEPSLFNAKILPGVVRENFKKSPISLLKGDKTDARCR